LGLGGGTVAKLANKYWPKSEIDGVEIDSVMVELGKKYLGLSNTKVVIQDAYEFIKKNKEIYDLVIVDLYVGDKFPKKFEEESFLKLLTKNKLVILNRLYFGEKRKEAVKFGNKLEKIFKKVDWVYPQANLMFFCYN
jgi:spermidine synthase